VAGFPSNWPALADADHRHLATDRNLDKLPSTMPSPGAIKDVGAIPAVPITNFRPLFLSPLQQTMPALHQLHPRPCYPSDRGVQMATAAQAPAIPTTTDPIERWLARRSACPQPDAEKMGTPAPPLPATYSKAQRAATNRANSAHSTGPRTESGKQRSSRNALSHGLTARTAVLPTEDPAAYQRHIQQFLDDHAPANSIETQLVHEIANTAWRLNRIPFLEAELLSQQPNPQTQIPLLSTLGLHGGRLSRQFQKALQQLRDIQEERRRLERRHLNEVAEILIRHQRKGLPWDPEGFSKEAGFVFSKEQVERHAQHLILQNPVYYAPTPRKQAAGAAF
jgi:hypothetical protein